MSLIPNGISAEEGGYTIERSLRFRKSASAYLNRTPSTTTNRKTWTWSGWVKRSRLGDRQGIFSAGSIGGSYNYSSIHFDGNDKLNYVFYPNATSTTLISTAQYRDPSAWYHVVVVFDTTQATASNRAKLYVNGSQITVFDTASYSGQNTDGYINQNLGHYFGRFPPGDSAYLDGYLTEINFIDGQALDPSYFGETDTDTGAWIAKEYTGSYGTNGFYLNFSDNTSTTTLGYDQSSNSNNWTTNNISLTAGSTYDSMQDVPTLTSASAGNYATLNSVFPPRITTLTFTNGNLDASASTVWASSVSTMSFPLTGQKYYAEMTVNSGTQANGINLGVTADVTSSLGGNTQHSISTCGVWYSSNGEKWVDGSFSAYGATYTNGDVIGIAVDTNSSTVTFYKNNSSQGSISFPSSLTNASLAMIGIDLYNRSVSLNFGQRPFAYTPPTGYKALNTYNLPDPTIKDGSDYFNTVLYTGTGSSRSVTGVGFQPDLVWIKSRSNAENHNVDDAVRGAGKWLASNLTQAETNDTGSWGVSSFDSDGFSIVNNGTRTNASGYTYAAWNWKANGSGVSNTDGSITSTVSANTSSGFSIVTYTGTGANATVGHGLGANLGMLIVKGRSVADAWAVWHNKAGSNGQWMKLNGTDALITQANVFNSTDPTSSVFSLGTNNQVNGSGQTYVAYAFAPIEGFSAFGEYTGNGSTGNGPFIYTGFRPAYILLKNESAGGSHWIINDDARNDYNYGTLGTFKALLANLNYAEDAAASGIDIFSNGWKMTQPGTSINNNGNVYVYAAFAENPFKYALAR